VTLNEDRLSEPLAVPPSAAKSLQMSRVRTHGTRLELYVRSRLHNAGRRFRVQRRDLPGSPDLVLPRFRFAVWVHGCFWHAHNCLKGTSLPKRNAEFWRAKLASNARRDELTANAVLSLGWEPVVIWECQLEDGVEALLRRCDEADAPQSHVTAV
jgi:DNA mismatch endonuclease (patch repair protein)